MKGVEGGGGGVGSWYFVHMYESKMILVPHLHYCLAQLYSAAASPSLHLHSDCSLATMSPPFQPNLLTTVSFFSTVSSSLFSSRTQKQVISRTLVS